MLENRSFDHLLGLSNINGADAVTGDPTVVNGLTGTESNQFGGNEFRVMPGAPHVMMTDPIHEFSDVTHQLCGPDVDYPPGGPYPTINNSGFASSYATGGGQDPEDVMRCFPPDDLPILNTLAREFVVCDNWFSSLPGPTWPNRMFVHAASSGGLDHSPSIAEIVVWETVNGFVLPNGTIFDRLSAKGIRRRLYGGDDFPMVAALKGIRLDDVRHYSLFATDLQQADYSDRYIFIEPSYDVLNQYRNGSSQHPLGDVTQGEALIKETYEAIRNSPVWNSSLLIITWDEHGGFYDHVHPGVAPAPLDNAPATHNQNRFTFEQYGPRVPALVISPLIPRNQIDHRVYDHASIPATLESLFGVEPLTERDRNANSLSALCTLATPRSDTPETLSGPVTSISSFAFGAPATNLRTASVAAPDETVNEGNLPAIVHSAMQRDLLLSPPDARESIVARVARIRTTADAREYMAEVQEKILPLRFKGAGQW
jgi:phospholipase C